MFKIPLSKYGKNLEIINLIKTWLCFRLEEKTPLNARWSKIVQRGKGEGKQKYSGGISLRSSSRTKNVFSYIRYLTN
jgi:hypothetical protein